MNPRYFALMLLVLAGCNRGATTGSSVVIEPPREPVRIQPGPNVQEEVQTALIKAKPGDVIVFAEGTYEFTMGLSLAVENVTLRGEGMEKTTLSFKNQNAGSEGLLVTRGGFVIEDLSVDEARGDGVKVTGVDNVTFRRVRAQWTGPPKETNGAYGLYPVQCKNVLIEDCVAIGASDAGIYVGQSQNIIVRRCRAERNVAGIEIENSTSADVYSNVATNNTGGLLVFDLPGLPVKNGRSIRVFNNQVYANNLPNFAAKGTMVASVPPGMGMMVMASDRVEMFQNNIRDNQTCNLAVVSFQVTGRPTKDDKEYDPFSEGVSIHDNVFSGGGDKPAGEFGQLFQLLLGSPVPDIVYDGIVNPAKLKDGKLPPELRLRIKNNSRRDGKVTFANLKLGELGSIDPNNKAESFLKLVTHKPKIDREMASYEGEHDSLPPVVLPGGP